MPTPFHLTSRIILITGASSGIGRQCAIQCSRMGASVVLLGRNAAELAVTQSLLPAGSESRIFVVAMEDYEGLAVAVSEAVQALGKISGLVHCAGISTTLPLRMVQPDKLADFLRINVVAAIELTRIVSKPAHFEAGGGSIVFMSSVMGSVGEAGKTLYSLTKGAINAGVKSLAVELARRRIRVNAISPGVVETPMSSQAVYSQDEAARAKTIALHPLGLGQPEDVANACVYLLSEASRWVTGTHLFVDGGYTAQ